MHGLQGEETGIFEDFIGKLIAYKSERVVCGSLQKSRDSVVMLLCSLRLNDCD
jgi:hypothetical protein